MFCGDDENTTFPAAPPQVCRHNNRLAPSGNNAQQHGVADQIEFHHGDLFEPLPADLHALGLRNGINTTTGSG